METPQTMIRLESEVLCFMPSRLRQAVIDALTPLGTRVDGLTEIRIREGMPPVLRCLGAEIVPRNVSYVTTREDITRVFNLVSANSVHAFEEEIRNGFVTIKGGHRIGMTGKVILEAGRVKTLRHIRSFNIRIARNCPGAAHHILPFVMSNGNPLSSLVAGAPGTGKTTVLRELARIWSEGSSGANPKNVSIVDERSEIAGCYGGIPQNDVGPRTDVLDACPKAEGVMMLIRSMAPDLVVTDEIGTAHDAQAILEALSSGVAVFASAHASSRDDLLRRGGIRTLLEAQAFSRIIILSTRHGPGTVEEIVDQDGKRIISEALGGVLRDAAGGS